ncbi:hypothetical protein SD80_020265 [Scytonema tolypothrichoides VB-61278]|nr:hypothetical protein SD80_020265 [Scytonema tolypothrichoides VB-61278]
MITYRIRGQLTTVGSNNVSGFRVELWDDDQRFDDRLGSGKTDSTGFFEFEFTDDDFRQEFLDFDRTPDLYFNVYQGRRRIGFTKPPKSVKLPSKDNSKPVSLDLFVIFNEEESESNYRIQSVKIEFVEDEATEKRTRQDFQEQPVTVYDILPTSNQIVGTGTQTSLTPVDNRGGSLQQIVDSALTEVLGRNLNSDPNAFLSTLTQTFTPKQTNGRTEYVWTARTYAAVQNDLGGTVSGAQASLYHRAKAALNDALPLLDKLYPLDPAADQQNMDAMRAIIRTELMELVDELGTTGGPRVQRVDNLFQLLIGSVEDTNSSENVGGQMKNLADVFGLSRGHINTVDEEQNYGNFLIIRDYIVSLRDSWNTYVQDTGGGAYVGTQLVLLSQALSVVAESVQEVYRIMDLVFLGPAERQAVLINFTLAKYQPKNPRNYGRRTSKDGKPVAFPLPDGTGYPEDELSKLTPPMSVEGLLKWAWRFGAEEGPTLAKAGGKLGIAQAIAETAERLMILVQAASFTPVRNTAFRREGVLRALRDLAFQLYQVQRLAAEIIPPPTNYQPDDIDQISPAANSNPTIPMRRITPSI